MNKPCRFCEKRYPSEVGETVCDRCKVLVERYVRSRLDQLNMLAVLICGRCGRDFAARRWRKPAYCGDACKQAAYRERYKRSAA